MKNLVRNILIQSKTVYITSILSGMLFLICVFYLAIFEEFNYIGLILLLSFTCFGILSWFSKILCDRVAWSRLHNALVSYGIEDKVLATQKNIEKTLHRYQRRQEEDLREHSYKNLVALQTLKFSLLEGDKGADDR